MPRVVLRVGDTFPVWSNFANSSILFCIKMLKNLNLHFHTLFSFAKVVSPVLATTVSNPIDRSNGKDDDADNVAPDDNHIAVIAQGSKLIRLKSGDITLLFKISS